MHCFKSFPLFSCGDLFFKKNIKIIIKKTSLRSTVVNSDSFKLPRAIDWYMQNLAIMFSKQRQIELGVQLLWWYFEFFFINYLLLLSGLDPSPPETSGSSATDFRGRRIGLFSAQILKQRLEIGRNKALRHESRLHVARWQLFRVMQTNLVYSIKIFETKKKLRVLFTFTKMSDRSHLNFNLVPRKIESLKHCYCSRKHLSLVFHDNLYYYWYSFG